MTASSDLIPHVNWLPALTAMNRPAGGVLTPKLLSPQQLMDPSLARMPQPCRVPALTAVNDPAGGVAWP
jgi:hypothetical protein